MEVTYTREQVDTIKGILRSQLDNPPLEYLVLLPISEFDFSSVRSKELVYACIVFHNEEEDQEVVYDDCGVCCIMCFKNTQVMCTEYDSSDIMFGSIMGSYMSKNIKGSSVFIIRKDSDIKITPKVCCHRVMEYLRVICTDTDHVKKYNQIREILSILE